MKKKLSIVGMFFSGIQLVASLYFIIFVLNNDYIHSDWLEDVKFGSDYNTYSYAASRSTALSTRDIGYLLKDAFTFLAVVIAILAVIEFIYFALKKTQSSQTKNEMED